MAVVNNTDFQLSPGEANPYGDRFYENIILPWVKAQLMCSSSRFVFKDPNLLLGLIPVGTVENTMPMRNIAGVSTSTKFHLSRFLVGLLLVILAFVAFSYGGGAIVLGLILLIIAIAQLANCLDAVLVVTNSAGGTQELQVSIFDKAKLELFKQEFQNRLFADQSQVHHDEAQQLRMQQTMLQQMALQQQIQANQGMMGAQTGISSIQMQPNAEMPVQQQAAQLPQQQAAQLPQQQAAQLPQVPQQMPVEQVPPNPPQLPTEQLPPNPPQLPTEQLPPNPPQLPTEQLPPTPPQIPTEQLPENPQ